MRGCLSLTIRGKYQYIAANALASIRNWELSLISHSVFTYPCKRISISLLAWHSSLNCDNGACVCVVQYSHFFGILREKALGTHDITHAGHRKKSYLLWWLALLHAWNDNNLLWLNCAFTQVLMYFVILKWKISPNVAFSILTFLAWKLEKSLIQTCLATSASAITSIFCGPKNTL